MTEFKGTPGEWLIEVLLVRKDSRVEVHECEIVADGCYAFGTDLVLAPIENEERVKQFEADMRLVVASKDLLEACLGALRIQELWSPVTGDHDEECAALNSMRKKFEAAIAKALGDG